tara:strand:- start:93 stop:395 length:303 start_codon:yes stop_codon:yes gene_type:complete
MAQYGSSSAYAKTQFKNKQFLDILTIRPVPENSDDVRYAIEPQYAYRPDLLAYDLYGEKNLWWVFAQRNMDVIKDPVYDMVPGMEIYIPQGESLFRVLGL